MYWLATTQNPSFQLKKSKTVGKGCFLYFLAPAWSSNQAGQIYPKIDIRNRQMNILPLFLIFNKKKGGGIGFEWSPTKHEKPTRWNKNLLLSNIYNIHIYPLLLKMSSYVWVNLMLFCGTYCVHIMFILMMC